MVLQKVPLVDISYGETFDQMLWGSSSWNLHCRGSSTSKHLQTNALTILITFCRIVTWVDKWIYFRNPNQRNQYFRLGHDSEAEVHIGFTSGMLVWTGHIVYSGGMSRDCFTLGYIWLYDALKDRYSTLANRRSPLLKRSNASAHNAIMTNSKFVCKIPTVQIYKSSDYRVFRAMIHFLTEAQ